MPWPAALGAVPWHPGLPATLPPLTPLLPFRAPTARTQAGSVGGCSQGWQKHNTGFYLFPDRSGWACWAPLSQPLALGSHHLSPEVSGNPSVVCLPPSRVHWDFVLWEACFQPPSPGPAPTKTSWVSRSTRRNFGGLLKAC